MTKNGKYEKPISPYIKGASIFGIFYISLKLLILPIVISIQTEKLAKIPDITPSDLCLILLIILFQTDLPNSIETLKISSGGFETKFKELKAEVDKQNEDIDIFQKQQIELIQQQQKELDSLQTFMFNFLLDGSKYKIIHYLNIYNKQKQPFYFYVTPNAAIDLRVLRDFKLIELIEEKSHISQMEIDSNRGDRDIDLTKYCRLTQLGHQFLKTRVELKNKLNKYDL